MLVRFFFFRAMSSAANKEQFLKQFDSIVRGIVDNKERVGKLSHVIPHLTMGFPALNNNKCYLTRVTSSAKKADITKEPAKVKEPKKPEYRH